MKYTANMEIIHRHLSSCIYDGNCILTPRVTVAIIAAINLVSSLVDIITHDSGYLDCCSLRMHVHSLKYVLIALFQFANVLLLISVIVENTLIIHFYVWYTLAFVKLGLIAAVLDFLLKYKHDGLPYCFLVLHEVAHYFVIFRCLRIVDAYRRHLEWIYVKA